MTPTNTILQRIVDLLAADTTTFASATLAVRVHLAKAAFTPAPTRVIGDFTEANFTGFAAKLAAVNAQQSFFDPTSGMRILQLIEPVGGWHWQCGDGLQLPQTIYGFYCTDNGNTTVYGSQLLPQPVVLTATLDAVDIGQVRLSFSPTTPT